MHADFNHHRQLNLERRLNILIDLNQNWTADHGGQLELWDEAMTHCVKSIVPHFNRCVIFDTSSRSYHGNPNPINHPRQQPRRSIALWYDTATWQAGKRSHTTQCQVRPGSGDQTDWKVALSELAAEIMPPMLTRNLRSLRARWRARLAR